MLCYFGNKRYNKFNHPSVKKLWIGNISNNEGNYNKDTFRKHS